MGVEIERRFLVRGDSWRGQTSGGGESPHGLAVAQGYLCAESGRVVRVRRMGEGAWLTIKGATHGCTRAEFEYPIPPEDAHALLTLCPSRVEKTRYEVKYHGDVWVVDEFHGRNAGLVLAEIELPAEDAPFARPPWLGEEVTTDSRYSNARLSETPYTAWADDTAQ